MDEDSDSMWWEQVSDTIGWLFITGFSAAMMFGGAVPYIPQYFDIKRSGNTEGFSLFVCFTLVIANILRIIFWFGHSYELPLLFQSIIMVFVMLIMIHLCVTVKNRTMIIKSRDRLFTDFDWRYFWEWTDFLSYIECIATITLFVGFLMYLFIDNSPFVEVIGFLAVFIEALIGVPQFHRNYINKSTVGMSKKMVLMWTFGDSFKTAYFVLRNAPIQFFICSLLQVTIDFLILGQVALYRSPPMLRVKPPASNN